MYKNKKWFALLLALCMMISLMPAANMENVQIEAGNGIAGVDEGIETPPEIEGYVGEVQVTLGGDEEAQNDNSGEESAPGTDTTEGDTTTEDKSEDQTDVPENVEPEGTNEPEGGIESEGTVEGAADTTENQDGAEGDVNENGATGEETAPEVGEDGAESASEDAEMFVVAGPEIKTQPKSWQGKVNKTASFTVKATSSKVTYLWEYHKAGATEFTAVTKKMSSSYNKATLKIKMTKALNGAVLRCKVTFKTADKDTNTKGFTYTDEVVMSSIKIKTQPVDTEVKLNKTASLKVATDATKPTYLWEYHKAGATEFVAVTSKMSSSTQKKATLKIKMTAALNGSVYRCKITDKSGVVVYSNEATLSIPAFKIGTQPVDVKKAVGETAQFKVAKVSGGKASYKYAWEYCTATMTEFAAVTKKMSSTYNKATMKLKVTADFGKKVIVRCKVTDKNNTVVYSNEAVLTIEDEPVIDHVKYKMVDGVMTVIGTDKDMDKYVVQEKVNGEVVKAIGEKAFEGNKKLVSIDLPDTIEVIGKRAFADCTKLSSMT